MIEENVSREMGNLAESKIEQICQLMTGIETSVIDYMADFVSALCGIDKNDLLTNASRAHTSQPRWFLWYSIRYLTNESYEKIAMRMHGIGLDVTPSGIGIGISKMSFLIESEPIWKKRWVIVKKIIKAYNEGIGLAGDNERKKKAVKVVIDKPDGIDVEVEFKRR